MCPQQHPLVVLFFSLLVLERVGGQAVVITFVTDATTSANDRSFMTTFRELDFGVISVFQTVAKASDALGVNALYISDSCDAQFALGYIFRDVPTPIVVWADHVVAQLHLGHATWSNTNEYLLFIHTCHHIADDLCINPPPPLPAHCSNNKADKDVELGTDCGVECNHCDGECTVQYRSDMAECYYKCGGGASAGGTCTDACEEAYGCYQDQYAGYVRVGGTPKAMLSYMVGPGADVVVTPGWCKGTGGGNSAAALQTGGSGVTSRLAGGSYATTEDPVTKDLIEGTLTSKWVSTQCYVASYDATIPISATNAPLWRTQCQKEFFNATSGKDENNWDPDCAPTRQTATVFIYYKGALLPDGERAPGIRIGLGIEGNSYIGILDTGTLLRDHVFGESLEGGPLITNSIPLNGARQVPKDYLSNSAAYCDPFQADQDLATCPKLARKRIGFTTNHRIDVQSATTVGMTLSLFEGDCTQVTCTGLPLTTYGNFVGSFPTGPGLQWGGFENRTTVYYVAAGNLLSASPAPSLKESGVTTDLKNSPQYYTVRMQAAANIKTTRGELATVYKTRFQTAYPAGCCDDTTPAAVAHSTPTTCPPSTPLTSGSYTCTKKTSGSTCPLVCNDGYKKSADWICAGSGTGSGVWSVETCDPIPCYFEPDDPVCPASTPNCAALSPNAGSVADCTGEASGYECVVDCYYGQSPTNWHCRAGKWIGYAPGQAPPDSVTVINDVHPTCEILNNPIITGVSPPEGTYAGGTVITISGSYFGIGAPGDPKPTVTIGGVTCTVTSRTRTEIVCTTTAFPTGETGVAGVQDVVLDGLGGGLPSDTCVDCFNVLGSPTVTSVTNPGGPVAGGNSVTIAGSNWGSPSVNTITVHFGSDTIGWTLCTNPTSFTIDGDANTVVCTAPAGTGTVSVKVTTTTATATTATATGVNLYIYYAPPVVTSVVPPAGKVTGGTVITVSTQNSIADNTLNIVQITINGNTCTNPTRVTATSYTCSTPAGACPTGCLGGGTSYEVILSTTFAGSNTGQTSPVKPRYGYFPPHTVTSTTSQCTGCTASTTPGQGRAQDAATGTAVTITGTGFMPRYTVDGQVFNSDTGVFGSWTSSVNMVTFSTDGTTWPYVCGANTVVTDTTITCTTNYYAAIFGLNADTGVKVRIDSPITGVYGSSTNIFTFNKPPSITAVIPTQGPRTALPITISGFSFGVIPGSWSAAINPITVTVGGAASPNCANPDLNNLADGVITCTLAANSFTGAQTIKVLAGLTGTSTSSALLTINAPPGFTVWPSNGPAVGGTVLNLHATTPADFGLTTSSTVAPTSNTGTVTFGAGPACTPVVKNHDAQLTSPLTTCATPAGTPGTQINVKLHTSLRGETVLPSAYQYNNPIEVTGLSAIDQQLPVGVAVAGTAQGPQAAGSQLVITGLYFLGDKWLKSPTDTTTANTFTVTIGTCGTVSATLSGSTLTTAALPECTTTGPHKVTVTSDRSGVGTVGMNYVINPEPTITSVTLDQGPLAGGVEIVIAGDNFGITSTNQKPNSFTVSLKLGATTLSCFGAGGGTAWVSNTEARCLTPSASASGTYTVEITSSLTGTATSSYTYNDPPGDCTSPCNGFGGNIESASTLAGLDTAQGPTTTTTAITIYGSNFGDPGTDNDVEVQFTNKANPSDTFTCSKTAAGGATLDTFHVDSEEITCTVPSGLTPGDYDYTVTTTFTGTKSFTDVFRVNAPPAVNGIFPAEGPIAGSTVITLTGDNFGVLTALYSNYNTVTVKLYENGDTATTAVDCADAEVVEIEGTTVITCTTGSITGGGDYQAEVTTVQTGTGALGGSFTYNDPPTADGADLVGAAFGPMVGGSTFKVVGTGFGPANDPGNTVTMYLCTKNGRGCAVDLADLATNGWEECGTTGYTTLDEVVCGGTGTPATNEPGYADILITTTVAGYVKITSGSSEGGFEYLPQPTVSGVLTFNPDDATSADTVAQGPTQGGTKLKIYVSDLGPLGGNADLSGNAVANQYTVKIGTLTCANPTVTITDDPETRDGYVECTAPVSTADDLLDVAVASTYGGAAGTVGSATDDDFQYNYPPAGPLLFTPRSEAPAEGGDDLTITGTNFGVDGTEAPNEFHVYFVNTGGEIVAECCPASGCTANGAWASETEAICVTPELGSGTYYLRITSSLTGATTFGAGNSFTVNAAPVLGGIDPNNGPLVGGTTVTITGSGFGKADAGNIVTVYFHDGTEWVAITDCTTTGTVDIESIVCTATGTPAFNDLTSLTTQPVDVYVHTVFTGTSDTMTDWFTYNPLPVVEELTTIAPSVSGAAQGPMAGGTTVSLTGTGFTCAEADCADLKVIFTNANDDSYECADVTVTPTGVTCVTLECTYTSGCPGDWEVTVSTDAAGSGTSSQTFTYNAEPVVLFLENYEGPLAGHSCGGDDSSICYGHRLTIIGTNFGDPAVCSGCVLGITLTKDTTTVTCGNVVWESDELANCELPTVTGAGDYVITVTSPLTTGPTGVTDASWPTFEYLNAPTVASVAVGLDPGEGSANGNTKITVEGTGFGTDANYAYTGAGSPVSSKSKIKVFVDGRECLLPTRLSDTQVTCFTPSYVGVTEPPVNVDVTVVTQYTGESAACVGCFKYLQAVGPKSVSPAEGPEAGGYDVTITGTGFKSSGLRVWMGVMEQGSATPKEAGTACPGTNAPAEALYCCDYCAAESEYCASASTDGNTHGACIPSAQTAGAGPSYRELAVVGYVGVNGDAATGVIVSIPAADDTTALAGSPDHKWSWYPASGLTGPQLMGIIVTTELNDPSPHLGLFTYNPKPQVTAINIPEGPITGGTVVRVSGRFFGTKSDENVVVVKIGTVDCAVTTHISSTEADCTTADRSTDLSGVDLAGRTLIVAIRTTYSGEETVRVSPDPDPNPTFIFNLKPTVTHVRQGTTITGGAPAEGPYNGGTAIFIEGANFGKNSNTLKIFVNGFLCTGSTWLSSTTASCTGTPAYTTGSTTAAVRVETTYSGVGVDTTTAAPAEDNFIYLEPPTVDFTYVTVTENQPAEGPGSGGMVITVRGTNFGSQPYAGLSVKLVTAAGGEKECASPTRLSTTEITCTTPVPAAVPTTFAQGWRGVWVHARGSTTASDAAAASAAATAATTAASGDGAAKKGSDVGEPGVGLYRINLKPELLGISQLQAPASLGEATVITLTGKHFGSWVTGTDGGVTSITVGGTTCTGPKFTQAAAPSKDSPGDAKATCTLPAATYIAGFKSVVITTLLSGQSTPNSNLFEFKSAPAITRVDLPEGNKAGGDSITIYGTNFGSIDCNTNVATQYCTVYNYATVSVGGNACVTDPAQTQPEATGDINTKKIVCQAPASGSATQAVVVITTKYSGSSTSSLTAQNGYIYNDDPTIVSIARTEGPDVGGQTVTITGTNFGTAASDIDVTFGTTTVSGTWISSTEIQCVTDPGTGLVDVTVVAAFNPKPVTFVDGYRFLAKPIVSSTYWEIESQTPAEGPTAGGQIIFVKGSNFGSYPVSVFIRRSDGLYAQCLDVTTGTGKFAPVSDTLITCVTPAALSTVATRSNRWVKVQVADIAPLWESAGCASDTACSACSACSAGQYVYNPLPVLSSISQGGAPWDALYKGASITITLTGTNFGTWLNDVTVTLQDASDGAGTSGCGTESCNAATWLTSTSMSCTLARKAECSGTGSDPWMTGVQNIRISTELSGQAAQTQGLLNYRPRPTVTKVVLREGPKAGAQVIHLYGTDFGVKGAAYPTPNSAEIEIKNEDGAAFTGVCSSPSIDSIVENYATCTTPAYTGTSFPAPMTVKITTLYAGESARATGLYKYNDLASITRIERVEGPVAGGHTVKVFGDNFGNFAPALPTPNPAAYLATDLLYVTIGGTRCTSTEWKSATEVWCVGTPAKAAGALNLQLFSLYTAPGGSNTITYTYLSTPTVTATMLVAGSVTRTTLPVAEGPLSGYQYITVQGTNFGTSDNVLTIYIGGTACLESDWISSTRASCLTPVGDSAGLVSVSIETGVSGVGAAASDKYEYNPLPTITRVENPEGPVGGGFTVTLYGSNFGSIDNDVTIEVKNSTSAAYIQCATPNWVSETEATCVMPENTGAGVAPMRIITELSGVSALENLFSYNDLPTIFSLSVKEGPDVGGTSITITGENFGNLDNTITITVVGIVCNSSTWVSSTEIVCVTDAYSSRLTGPELGDVVVDVEFSGEGELVDAFTYNPAPTITGVEPPEGPRAGGVVITISGSSFGSTGEGNEIEIYINGVKCIESVWLSEFNATCLTPPVDGASTTDVDVKIITTHTGESEPLVDGYQYTEAPIIDSTNGVSPSEGPLAGGQYVTVSGTGFGAASGAVIVFIGDNECQTSTWLSPTEIQCLTPRGASTGLTDVRVWTLRTGDGEALPQAYLYNPPPRVTKLVDDDGNTVVESIGTGGSRVTLVGVNFGTTENDVNVTVGGFACENAVWLSPTEIACDLPDLEGLTGVQPVFVKTEYSGEAVGAVNLITYNPEPVVDRAEPAEGPIDVSMTITIIGENFGRSSSGLNSVEGGVVVFLVPEGDLAEQKCEQTLWISPTELWCTISRSETGFVGARVEIIVAGVGSKDNVYKFNGKPRVDGIEPSEGPKEGGTEITVTGENFGGSGGAIRIDFCDSNDPTWCFECLDPTWVSDTELTCTTPAVDVSGEGWQLKVTTEFSGESDPVPGFKFIGQPDASESTFVADPTSLVADGVATTVLTLVVRDSDGNPVPRVSASVSDNGVRLDYAPDESALARAQLKLTDEGGVVEYRVSSFVAQPTVTFTATCGDVEIADKPEVDFLVGPVDMGDSLVVGYPPQAIADGVDRVWIVVTLVDSNGNILRDVNVTLTPDGGSSKISGHNATTGGESLQTWAITNASGVALFSATNLEPEGVQYSASVGSVELLRTVFAVFVTGPPDVSRSTVEAYPTSVLNDGVEESRIQVTVKDTANHTLADVSVVLKQEAPKGLPQNPRSSVIKVDPASALETDSDIAVTNAAGVAVFVVTNLEEEVVEYVATLVDVGDVEDTAIVEFIANTGSEFQTTKKEEEERVAADERTDLVYALLALIAVCLLIAAFLAYRRAQGKQLDEESEDVDALMWNMGESEDFDFDAHVVLHQRELEFLLSDYNRLKEEHAAHLQAQEDMLDANLDVHALHEMDDDKLKELLDDFETLKIKKHGGDAGEERFFASHHHLREVVSTHKKVLENENLQDNADGSDEIMLSSLSA